MIFDESGLPLAELLENLEPKPRRRMLPYEPPLAWSEPKLAAAFAWGVEVGVNGAMLRAGHALQSMEKQMVETRQRQIGKLRKRLRRGRSR